MEPSVERPVTPTRNLNINPNLLQVTPNSAGSGSGLSALTAFHVKQVHELVWLDVLTFQTGSFKRLLHRQLSLVGAIHPTNRVNSMTEIDNVLADCLKPILKIMNDPENLEKMDTIRTAMQDYCSESYESDRYQHFVLAANTALSLLVGVKIGNSIRCPRFDDDDSLLFMVHDPRTMKSRHKNVEYTRKPDVVAAFRKHICALYTSDDLLQAVTVAPEEQFSLPWKQALMCVEKKLANKKIIKKISKSYSFKALPEGVVKDKNTIQMELNEKEEIDETAGQPTGSDGKTSGKRPAEDDSVGSGSKKSKTSAGKKTVSKSLPTVEIKAPSKAAQVADYAAEAMYNCFGRSHVINLLVTDTTVNVWYFDHESPIQMTAFDFVDDLPYFFLFLFTLQRFTLAHWGYIPDIVPINQGERFDISRVWAHASSSLQPQTALFSVPKGTKLYPKFGLNGRATGALAGNVMVNGVKRDVVVKLSYQEKSRTREHKFVQAAQDKFKKKYDDVCDYLPEFLGFWEYDDFNSVIVRKAVLVNLSDLDLRPKAARIPYLVVLPKYMPIASLTTNWTVFLNAFFALIYCHAMLWDVGIEHGDISEANLMWDPKNKKPKLCDFDLSHFTGQERPTGFSNTGTWAFMALELLTELAMEGKAERFYRHDLESFFAVLIWILFRYHNGKLLSKPPLEEWNQPRYTECADKRKTTYAKLRPDLVPNEFPADKWDKCVQAILTYESEQHLAIAFRGRVKVKILGNVPLSDTEKRKLEYVQSVKFLGPVLSYPLFEGDGSEFIEKLRKYLPNRLPSESPLL